MFVATKPIVGLADCDARFKEMSLTRKGLQDALRGGSRFRASLTEHDTPIIRGAGPYNAINVVLADTFKPEGWQVVDVRGFRQLVHPDGEIMVVVHSGNNCVGRPDGHPANGYPYDGGGRRALRAVVKNNYRLATQGYFQDVDQDFGQRGWTYLLLHHIDIDAGLIQAELSAPLRIDGAFLSEFYERIMLPDLEAHRVATKDMGLMDVDDEEGKDEFLGFEVIPKSV